MWINCYSEFGETEKLAAVEPWYGFQANSGERGPDIVRQWLPIIRVGDLERSSERTECAGIEGYRTTCSTFAIVRRGKVRTLLEIRQEVIERIIVVADNIRPLPVGPESSSVRVVSALSRLSKQ